MLVIGFDIFRGIFTQGQPFPVAPGSPEETPAPISSPVSDEVAESSESPVFYMRTREGDNAQAQLIDGEFTLLEGPVIPGGMKDNPNIAESTRKQHVMRAAQRVKVLEISVSGPKPSPGHAVEGLCL